MTTNLLFDFTVDKKNNTVKVQREFAANLDIVWDAWTRAELLDQWWAPKPYRAETKSMSFKEGGHWLYAMVSPDNTAVWCRVDYQKIDPKKSFSAIDTFCDENGKAEELFPGAHWTNTFNENQETTTVNVLVRFKSLEDLEKIIAMGFKDGFTMALGNLDQYIASQFRLRKEYKTEHTARVCTYLNFPGNTEEAFNFYKSVFKTEFIGGKVHRFGEIPQEAGNPPIADAVKKMVLHVQLPTIGNHILMGTDAPKEMGFNLTQGNNMHISLEPDSREEATRLFNELSAGGNITMPLQDMFFGSYFGEFTDKYGINWMINYQNHN